MDVTYSGKPRKLALIIVVVVAALLGATTTPAQAALKSVSDPVPSFKGTVLAIAYSGNTMYVGGDFTAAVVNGKTYPRAHLAAVDVGTGTLLPWAPVTDGRVKAIAVSGSSVYVAGEFTTVGGLNRDSLARLDAGSGAVANTFKHTILGKPYALAAAGTRLYLGGTITSVNGQTRTRLAAFDLNSGALDATWKPAVDDQVETIATAAGRIYVGGRFHKVGSTSGYDRLAALDPVSGALVTGFKPKPSVIAYGIAVTSTGVYSAHGGQGGKINAYTLTGALRWTATFDGDAQAVGVLGDTVYAGGHFDNACRTASTGSSGVCLDGATSRVKLAGLDVNTGALRPWTANANGVDGVLTMAVSPALARVAAGGAFTTIAGVSQKRLAQFS